MIAMALAVMWREWEWGGADCCTAACDVFLRAWGVDPMAELRGTYQSESGAARAIVARGGWLAMAQGLADGAGLVRSDRVGALGLGVVAGAFGGRALVIQAAPGVWLGKTLTGCKTVNNVEASWCVKL
jgi:hypothetical protein